MSLTTAADRDETTLLAHFSMRPALHADFIAARTALSHRLYRDDMRAWFGTVRTLYEANAGPGVLSALWALQRHALGGTDAAAVLAYALPVLQICRNCGSAGAISILAAVTKALPYGGDGRNHGLYLDTVAALAARAPDAVPAIATKTGLLMSRLAPADIAAWIDDGIRLYPADRRRRRAYFRLEDPLARRRLAVHEGHARFAAHEPRLKYLARCLWDLELETRRLPQDPEKPGLGRMRLAGSLVLVPESMPQIATAETTAFFEAAIMHAMAHRRFTTALFAVGRMKPMQRALTGLIEDARVERLAARDYPGLAQLWRQFHRQPASRARTCGSLFARLARALADPDFEDADGWVNKGREMFETAFSETPSDQQMSVRLARILGHDLGQARIPFDAKSHIVEPAYRDDGFGLFDMDDMSSADPETLEILLDAARMEPQERDEPGETPPDEGAQQQARSRPAAAAEEERGLLATYPEWDYRLRSDQNAMATLYDLAVTAVPSPNWLSAAVDDHRQAAARIGGLIRRARFGRAIRLRRRMDGDDLDIEAVQETRIARRSRTLPDPRIYTAKRRLERDVSVALLIDTSQSTEARLGGDGPTILQTSALSSALLGRALSALGDPFAIYAFCSNGRDDVQMATIKDFDGDDAALIGRLAGLRPAYSTRLGAAIRHVAGRLDRQTTLRKLLIVITDGEPADIDADDPLYLVEDARHAVAKARDLGLDLFCVALGPQATQASAAIFGRRNTLPVERIEDLHQRLAGLYFRLTVN